MKCQPGIHGPSATDPSVTESLVVKMKNIKGSSDPSHFIFGINVGKRRILHRIQRRSLSDPTLSDIDFKNKMA